jgi:hypothetical protein
MNTTAVATTNRKTVSFSDASGARIAVAISVGAALLEEVFERSDPDGSELVAISILRL